MNAETTLDAAHAAMQANPEDDAARLRFYGVLADSELFVLLEREPEGRDAISPEILDLEGDLFALVFDSEERLSGFARRIAPYAALPGRAIAGMLAGRNIGLGLNLGVAPSSILIPPEAMSWLAEALAEAVSEAPEAGQGGTLSFTAPDPALGALAPALAQKLAAAGAMGARAWLVGARFQDGADGAAKPALVMAGVPEAAEPSLARASREVLLFSGLAIPELATLFLPATSPRLAAIAATGLEIRFPKPAPATVAAPPAPPGSDPDKPPKLR
ncbi:MAG TPA: SseB family protein [Rhodobacteraceae bacterium]|nr:SseB family protein [Paracoccaceae bacterium]